MSTTALEQVTRVTIDPELFIHEEDRRALAALKKVPFFDKVCSSFITHINEPVLNVFDMSSKIHITEEQLPRIFEMVKEICEDLSIEIPNIYLELNRNPNAYTYGDKRPTVTVTSGLLECLDDEEIYTVLAHECGHIACHHVLYHTMGAWLLNGGSLGIESILGKNLLTEAIMTPLRYAFFRWMRASELSADRAAALCCRKDTYVVSAMMRLAGGTKNINEQINEELFAHQAIEYRSMLDEKKSNKLIELALTFYNTHPMNAVRAYEIKKWCDDEVFKDMVLRLPKRKVKEEVKETKKRKKWYEFWKK